VLYRIDESKHAVIEHYNGTAPGASIVQAVGFTGSSLAYNPLSLQNG
jgi:hypothetical protein